jgi:hypothetical protein
MPSVRSSRAEGGLWGGDGPEAAAGSAEAGSEAEAREAQEGKASALGA